MSENLQMIKNLNIELNAVAYVKIHKNLNGVRDCLQNLMKMVKKTNEELMQGNADKYLQ